MIVLALLALAIAQPSIARPGVGKSSPPKAKQVHCKNETPASFREFSEAVWRLPAWQRGKPPRKVIEAQRHRVHCAGGRRHALQTRWHHDQDRYFRQRHRCRSGAVVEGRVSVFGGGLMASGHYTSEPAIALNIAPGTEGGWNNSTTRTWVAHQQRFRVTIAGHTAVLFDGDLGPAASTYRSIDVSEGGAAALRLSVSYFPTDSIGRAKLIPPGC